MALGVGLSSRWSLQRRIVATVINTDGNSNRIGEAVRDAVPLFDSIDDQMTALETDFPDVIFDGILDEINFKLSLEEIGAQMQYQINTIRAAIVPETWSWDSTFVTFDSLIATFDGYAGRKTTTPPVVTGGFWSLPFWTRTSFWQGATAPVFSFWSTPFWTRTSFWGN